MYNVPRLCIFIVLLQSRGIESGKISKYRMSSIGKMFTRISCFSSGRNLIFFRSGFSAIEYIATMAIGYPFFYYYLQFYRVFFSFDKLYFLILSRRSRDMLSSDRDSVFSHITVVYSVQL